MRELGILDVLGPVMIGPSSSHTAGAVRLGNAAAMIHRRPVERMDFYLHGSFAKTYRGHGTDKALVAGVLGLPTDDERIRGAFALAQERGIAVGFHERDLGYVHPNTVRIDLSGAEGNSSITGSSLGGGMIEIIRIGETELSLHADYPTLILEYTDQPGLISRISAVISGAGVNIASMRVGRVQKKATMVLELDGTIGEDIYQKFVNDPVFDTVLDIGAREVSRGI